VLLDEFQIPKLCDFGLSRVMDSAQTQAMTMQIGTPAYMAPELMTGQAGTAPSSPSSQLASPHVSSPGILAHPDTSAEGKSEEDIGSEEEGRAPPDALGALPPSSPPCTTRNIQGHVRLARENSISILNRLTDLETSKAGGGTMLSSSGIKTSSGGVGKQASSSRAQSRKIDVYSFGILLWSFWTRRHPYADKGLNTFQLIRQVADEGLRPTITAEDMPAERSTSETGERVQLTPEERQRRKATQVGLRRSRCMCGVVRARARLRSALITICTPGRAAHLLALSPHVRVSHVARAEIGWVDLPVLVKRAGTKTRVHRDCSTARGPAAAGGARGGVRTINIDKLQLQQTCTASPKCAPCALVLKSGFNMRLNGALVLLCFAVLFTAEPEPSPR
jgi:serine/threonine protein kinase